MTSEHTKQNTAEEAVWMVREDLAIFLEEAFGDPDKVQPAPNNSRVFSQFWAFLRTMFGNGSLATCLRAWSRFVRVRDGDRCVLCHSRRNLTAHHICRKSFLPIAQLQSGNGMTLCRKCHKDTHAGFNGRPDLALPMDAQGGEKIERMLFLYEALAHDARTRGLIHDPYYFLSESVLTIFKQFQGMDPKTIVCGYRVEQAVQIWKAPPGNTMRAMLRCVLEE